MERYGYLQYLIIPFHYIEVILLHNQAIFLSQHFKNHSIKKQNMKKINFLTLLLAISPLIGEAQVSTYTFQRGGATFPYLVSTGANIIDHVVNDDSVSPAIVSLPFAFNFGGINYNSIGISENGFIWFGPAQPSGVSLLKPISTTQSSSVKGIISAMGIDLHPYSSSVVQTKISSAVLGQAPNRIFVIEWFGTSRIESLDDAAGPDIIDFQIRLLETSNSVEIIYGRTILNANITSELEVGLKTTNTDFNVRTTDNTNWTFTNAGSALNNTCKLGVVIKPAFGQKFIWSPNTLGVDDFNPNQVVLYPNPATDILQVAGLEQDTFDYIIFDMTGRIVKQQKGLNNLISLDGLSAGHYIVNITSDNFTLSRKFIKS